MLAVYTDVLYSNHTGWNELRVLHWTVLANSPRYACWRQVPAASLPEAASQVRGAHAMCHQGLTECGASRIIIRVFHKRFVLSRTWLKQVWFAGLWRAHHAWDRCRLSFANVSAVFAWTFELSSAFNLTDSLKFFTGGQRFFKRSWVGKPSQAFSDGAVVTVTRRFKGRFQGKRQMEYHVLQDSTCIHECFCVRS